MTNVKFPAPKALPLRKEYTVLICEKTGLAPEPVSLWWQGYEYLPATKRTPSINQPLSEAATSVIYPITSNINKPSISIEKLEKGTLLTKMNMSFSSHGYKQKKIEIILLRNNILNI
jgi:hypothetical protein